MLIDTDSLLAHVREVKANAAQREACKKIKAIADFNTSLTSIIDNIDKIKAFVPIAEEVGSWRDCPLFTDGISHKLGFSPSDVNLFGKCGGGFSGRSFFVNTATSKFKICSSHDETTSPDLTIEEVLERWDDANVVSKAHDIATDFNEFAKAVSEFVMSEFVMSMK